MSKKFTSLLVLAILALAIPVQGQNFAKKAVKKQQKFEVKHALKGQDFKANLEKAKAAKAKAEDKTEGIAFRGGKAVVEAPVVSTVEQDKAAKQAEAMNPVAPWNWAKHAAPQYVSKSPLFGSQNRTISPSELAVLLAKQAKNGRRAATRRAEADPDFATVTLTAGDVWGDNSGYQLLLDADATAYGTIIPESGPLTSSGDAADGVYDAFEYKIPENADGSLTTTNIVFENSITIKIPEGTYDWVVTNPSPGDRIWIASDGRGDDYVFEKGKVYEFSVALSGSNDKVTFTIDGEEPEVEIPSAPYTADFSTSAPLANFYVIDANEDGNTWTWSANYGAYYGYSSTNNADDYLVLPINLEGGKNYNVTVTAASSSTYPEKFEVVAGAEFSVAGFTSTVIAETEIKTSTDTDYEGVFSPSADGTYYVAIHATSDADQFNLKIKKLVIEVGAADTAPAAVSDFAVVQVPDELKATVSFKAPTKSIAGDALTENIAKIEVLRNEEVVKTFENVAPGAELSYVDEVPTAGKYAYQVIPYDATGIGAKSDVIELLIASSVNVPYTVDFSKAGVIDLFTVIDNNADGSTWMWSASNNAYYKYDNTNAGDDYLVSLPINMEAGKTYDVIVNAKAYNGNYPERFEVVAGKEPTAAALTTVVIPATDLTTTEAADYDGSFTATETGKYYVAIHAISDPYEYYLIVNSLSVVAGAEPTAPAAPVIAVTPGAEGALAATVQVTAPTKNVAGDALTANIDIEVLVDGEVIETKTGVAPGAEITVQHTPAAAGTFTYQAIPYNASGKGLKSAKVSAYVGMDIPFAPTNIQMVDNGSNINFSWDAVPNVGENDAYVNPATVNYNVWSIVLEQYLFWTIPTHENKLATVTGQTSAVANFNTEEGKQEFKYFSVQATNETANDEEVANESYTGMLIGKSYDLPFNEGFAGNTLHYYWTSNAELMISEEATDDDGVALQLITGEPGEVYFESGKINIKDAVNPTLIFDVKSPNISQLKVLASVEGGEAQTVQTVNLTAENQTVKLPLAAYKNGRFVQIAFVATYAQGYTGEYDEDYNFIITDPGDYVIMDAIRVVDLYEYNLGVTVSAPATVTAGQKATIKAVVENKGENAANGYSIIVKAGDKELLNKTVDESLAPFKKSEFEADFETSVFDEAGDVTITAEVIYENDLEPDDNKAEGIITIKEPTAPAPEGLTATDKGDAGVDLAWSAPGSTEAAARASVAEETENFDDESVFEPFSIGGITAEQQTGAFGDWTLYDGNNMTVYSFNGITLPNANAASAWQVFNITGDGAALAENFGAHSGNQYLMSFCPADQNSAPAANHWLISPELPGIAQTISFYARAITNQYGEETFEVLASSTDNKPESFAIVGSAYSTSATEWTEFTAELPAGTKFFAIRHTSTDIFGLMVDDVTYLVGGAEVKSYNIYYEGEKIADVAGDVTTYTVAANKIQAGQHNFSVTAVYANGSESKPISAQVEVTTGIQKIATDGKPVDVYALDGKLVRQQTKSLDGLKGVYVINGKKVMIK